MAVSVKGKAVSLNEVLKGVSRSFYLSLRLLPGGVREPLSLGYLLARASDTIADTETVSVAAREDLLSGYREALHAGTLSGFTNVLGEEFIEAIPDPREQRLMRQLDEIEAALGALPSDQQKEIQWVLGPIIDGQLWDLTFFKGGTLTQTQSEDQLLTYTYQVAGCVGEFWTKIGFLDSSEYASKSKDQMLEWGRHYGQALQLINILRDEKRDLELGRIYFPSDERAKWLSQAREWLNEALEYGQAVSRRRMRTPTILPALLGFETLNLIERDGPGAKVSRKEVYECLWQAVIF